MALRLSATLLAALSLTCCRPGAFGARDDSGTPNPGSDSGTPSTGDSDDDGGGAPSTGTDGGTGPVAIGLSFTAYKDITTNANWNTNVISSKLTGELLPIVEALPEVGAVSWSFATGECGSETWGGMNADAVATSNVPAWSHAGKRYVLSTGGAAGTFTCKSDAGFAAFLDRYMSDALVGVDFDIEGGQTPEVIAGLVARAKAAQQDPRYARLRFSFTIATLGGSGEQNLGPMGHAVMVALKSGGLDNAFVNLMTMDFGSTNANNCSIGAGGRCDMGASAIAAAKSLHRHDGIPFSHIELTPMIGGNDTQDETFTIADVDTVAAFAKESGLGAVHIWSLDRDTDCPAGFASPICNSYGEAGTLGFTHAFLNALR